MSSLSSLPSPTRLLHPPASPKPTRPSLISLRPSGPIATAAVGKKYKGTAMREEKLTEMIEKKVAEAMEACDGDDAKGSDSCKVAWDEVEEVSQAKADLRRRLAESDVDPLESFCGDHPWMGYMRKHNTKLLVDMVREQFKKHKHETDPVMTQRLKDDAARGLINHMLYESGKKCQDTSSGSG